MWTTGLIGPYAGLFDGTRYVSISGVSELRPTTEATVGVWFKATTVDVGGSALVALPNDGLMPYLTSLGRAACQMYDELGHFVTITSSGSYLDDFRHFLNCSYLIYGVMRGLRTHTTRLGRSRMRSISIIIILSGIPALKPSISRKASSTSSIIRLLIRCRLLSTLMLPRHPSTPLITIIIPGRISGRSTLVRFLGSPPGKRPVVATAIVRTL